MNGEAQSDEKRGWFSSWVEPAVILTIAAGLLSVGGLYARVDTLERSDSEQQKYGERISGMESTLNHVGHQLDQIEAKIDAQRQR